MSLAENCAVSESKNSSCVCRWRRAACFSRTLHIGFEIFENS